jgi:hypothetical protein
LGNRLERLEAEGLGVRHLLCQLVAKFNLGRIQLDEVRPLEGEGLVNRSINEEVLGVGLHLACSLETPL